MTALLEAKNVVAQCKFETAATAAIEAWRAEFF